MVVLPDLKNDKDFKNYSGIFMKKIFLLSFSYLISLNAFAVDEWRAPAAKKFEQESLSVKITPKHFIKIKVKNSTDTQVKVYKEAQHDEFLNDLCKSNRVMDVLLSPGETFDSGSCSYKVEYVNSAQEVIRSTESMIKINFAIYQEDLGSYWSNYWFTSPGKGTTMIWSYSNHSNFKYRDFNKFLFTPTVADTKHNPLGDICINVTGVSQKMTSEYVDCNSI